MSYCRGDCLFSLNRIGVMEPSRWANDHSTRLATRAVFAQNFLLWILTSFNGLYIAALDLSVLDKHCHSIIASLERRCYGSLCVKYTCGGNSAGVFQMIRIDALCGERHIEFIRFVRRSGYGSNIIKILQKSATSEVECHLLLSKSRTNTTCSNDPK